MPRPPTIWFEKVDEVEAPTREGTAWSAEGHRSFFRKFLVVLKRNILDQVDVDLKKAGTIIVCQAPGIPLPGALYASEDISEIGEFDFLAQAVNFSAVHVDQGYPYAWYVTVEYSTRVPEGGLAVDLGWADQLGGAANNPDLEPWHIEWDPEVVMTTPQRDLDGLPFTNSATQPVSPPPQLEQARARLLIVRNELTFSATTITKYSFAANSDTFFGYAPGTVRCLPPRAVQMYRGSMKYFRVRWTLEFGVIKPLSITEEAAIAILGGTLGTTDLNYKVLESWEYMEYLDQGLCRLQNNAAGPKKDEPIPIRTPGGHPITQPDLLDGHGQPVVPSAEGFRAPVFLKRRVRRTLPFDPIFTIGLGGGI